jgi:hypothetical protein
MSQVIEAIKACWRGQGLLTQGFTGHGSMGQVQVSIRICPDDYPQVRALHPTANLIQNLKILWVLDKQHKEWQ